MPRLTKENYLNRLQQWIEVASQDKENLYTVKLTDKYSDQPIISIDKFAKLLKLPKSSGRIILSNHCRAEMDQVWELMRSEGLILAGHSANNLNLINSLKLLLLRLEADSSLLRRIPISGNKISGQRLIHEFPEYELSTTIYNVRATAENQSVFYFRNVFTVRVLELLKEVGIHDYSTYVPVSERETPESSVTLIAVFSEARKKMNIVSVDELDAICKGPFDNILFLCALGARGVSAVSSISNFNATYQQLKKFCKSQGLFGTEPVFEVFTEYFAIKFRAYLEDLVATRELSPSWASTMLSCLQLSLSRFSELAGAHEYSYIKVAGFDVRGRTTDTYRPYSKQQREIIAKVLEKEIQWVWNRHRTPYKKSQSGGQAFIKDVVNGVRIDGDLCTEQNLRWFFDHQLQSKRITSNDISALERKSNEQLFYSAVQNYWRRNSDVSPKLEELYEDWGVPRDVYREELFPFYMRLLQVTGMNPMSALDLEIDSFEPQHPATLKPCLRYWKERSSGSKEMHLDIFDSEITWLSKSQASVVSEIIGKVKVLTESLRSRLPDDHEYSRLLFIAVGKPPRGYGKVQRLFLKSYDNIRGHFENKYRDDLVDLATGEMISLVGTRFRASLVSEMVEAGVSIREIQLMLGHASISTTLGYLDRMDFNKQARLKIQEKLQQIYENSWVPKEQMSISAPEKYRGEIIFKTPLGGCANIFNPPDFVKNSKGYDGGACSNFNKCLSCENVIITQSHLPDLFALFRDYQTAWQHGTVASTPYGSVIRENIEILKSILGDDSEFEKGELEEAERLSRYIDSAVRIDGVAL